MKSFFLSLLLAGLPALSPHPFVSAEASPDALAAAKILADGFPEVSSFFQVRDVEVTDDEDIVYLETRTDKLPFHLESRAAKKEADTYCHSFDITVDKFTIPKKDGTKERERRLFSSRLQFPNVKDAYKELLDGSETSKDAQLSSIARDAMVEMRKNGDFIALKDKDRPAVMTAMAIGNEIYLSSSVKGDKGGYVYTDLLGNDPTSRIKNAIGDCLLNCQKRFKEDREGVEDPPVADQDIHRRGAACGECNAAVQYFQDHPTAKDFKGAVFVTINENTRYGDGETIPVDIMDRLQVMDPCGKDGLEPESAKFLTEWGCTSFVTVGGGRGITNNKFEPYIMGKKTGWKQSEYEKSKTFYKTSQTKINVNRIKPARK